MHEPALLSKKKVGWGGGAVRYMLEIRMISFGRYSGLPPSMIAVARYIVMAECGFPAVGLVSSVSSV